MIEISNIQVQRDFKEHDKSITEILYEVAEDIYATTTANTRSNGMKKKRAVSYARAISAKIAH